MTLSQAFKSLVSGEITVDEYLEHYRPEDRPHVYIPPLSVRPIGARNSVQQRKHRSSRCLDNIRDDPFFGSSL